MVIHGRGVGWQVMMALMAMARNILARSRLTVGNAHKKTRTQILSTPAFVHLCILFFCVREEHVRRCCSFVVDAL
jgi:hypothetical protein